MCVTVRRREVGGGGYSRGFQQVAYPHAIQVLASNVGQELQALGVALGNDLSQHLVVGHGLQPKARHAIGALPNLLFLFLISWVSHLCNEQTDRVNSSHCGAALDAKHHFVFGTFLLRRVHIGWVEAVGNNLCTLCKERRKQRCILCLHLLALFNLLRLQLLKVLLEGCGSGGVCLSGCLPASQSAKWLNIHAASSEHPAFESLPLGGA